MNWNSPEIMAVVRRALAEDLGSGDATALATVPSSASAHAHILARAGLVVAGLPLAKGVFQALDSTVQSVLALGLLVIVRTFLSWSLILEVEGRWPWQPKVIPGDTQ